MGPSGRALAAVVVGIVIASFVFPYTAWGESPQVGGYATVQNTDGDGLRLRSGIWSGILWNLPEGAMVKVLDEATDRAGDSWYQVEVAGTEGWVFGSYLGQISEEEAERRSSTTRGGIRSTAADIAVQYEGYRYVWGGKSPATGFDSSGFLFYVYQTLGRPIPRDYWGMMEEGTPVPANQLQPGDLVFFVNTYMRGLSHGGIYIGNGRFIHAVDERSGVRIDYLWREYYSTRYYGARRML